MIDLRRIQGRWRRYDTVVRDLPLALVIVAASLVPALHGYGTQLGELPTRPFDAVAVALVALQGLPLALRRRWPLACLGLVSIGFVADQLLAYHTVAGVALGIALLSAGAHLERQRRTILLLATAAYLALALTLHWLGSPEGVIGFGTFYIVLGICWGAGAWLRLSRAAEAERRRHVAEASRVAERTRIARELHDIVTHHVTAMVVQAESARYLTAAPDRLDQTLTAVSDTGRRAIADLRHLLDLLNPDHDTETGTPTTGDLKSLVEQVRRAGQPVELVREGEPAAVGGSAEEVAYRVVQEALTNAVKYAHGSRTLVQVRYREQETTVEITTDGPAVPSVGSGGSGRGLRGLRDRVELLGGEFSADRHPDGGFSVRARIPAAASSRSAAAARSAG
ncbi:two-component sensor histidine kinase [Natronosporangium hydrolyticum]|uniref:histidine kinase n=1 Tax=Natronosporangium hydrolyticum TaxID=2811111 RepID=A0A895YBY1_9ACTN|nr:histidine kinase [Natronosporangium hydrolyticum]QSB12829.1 two-component sensor histidine kinase [Natronosporangium hydrolyticum]